MFSALHTWYTQGRAVALATVLQTWGSAPRPSGAQMAVAARTELSGSVSGGCVEGAVAEAALEALQTRRGRILHFGVADETAWEVGLACGGTIEIFVQPLDNPALGTLLTTLEKAAHTPDGYAWTTVVRGPEALVGAMWVGEEQLGNTVNLGELVNTASQAALAKGQPQRLMLTPDIEVFINVILPPPTLIIIGGVHIAQALATMAETVGYVVTVVDPRAAFSHSARFKESVQLVREWPDDALRHLPITRATAIAALTHDPKLDDPALQIALPSPAFYVGALGSKTTQAQRRERLLATGLAPEAVARLHGPIGLDLNAKSPEEIALAILAEIVQERNHRTTPEWPSVEV